MNTDFLYKYLKYKTKYNQVFYEKLTNSNNIIKNQLKGGHANIFQDCCKDNDFNSRFDDQFIEGEGNNISVQDILKNNSTSKNRPSLLRRRMDFLLNKFVTERNTKTNELKQKIRDAKDNMKDEIKKKEIDLINKYFFSLACETYKEIILITPEIAMLDFQCPSCRVPNGYKHETQILNFNKFNIINNMIIQCIDGYISVLKISEFCNEEESLKLILLKRKIQYLEEYIIKNYDSASDKDKNNYKVILEEFKKNLPLLDSETINPIKIEFKSFFDKLETIPAPATLVNNIMGFFKKK